MSKPLVLRGPGPSKTGAGGTKEDARRHEEGHHGQGGHQRQRHEGHHEEVGNKQQWGEWGSKRKGWVTSKGTKWGIRSRRSKRFTVRKVVKGGTSDKWSKVRTTNKSGLAGHKELIKEDQVGHQPQWGKGKFKEVGGTMRRLAIHWKWEKGENRWGASLCSISLLLMVSMLL
jgi:hypothetical protein